MSAMMIYGLSDPWKNMTMKTKLGPHRLFTALMTIWFLLTAFTPCAQQASINHVIEHISSNRPYKSDLYLVYTHDERDSLESYLKKALYQKALALEIVVTEGLTQHEHVERYLVDALEAGKTESQQVYVIDFTDDQSGARGLLNKFSGNISGVLAFGRFKGELYYAFPGKVAFWPRSKLKLEDIDQQVRSHFTPRSMDGSVITERQEVKKKERDRRVANAQRGLWYLGAQRGTWFLLSGREDDNGRYRLKGSGSVYRFSLGYGISRRLTVRAGLNLSFERPNEDETASQAATNQPIPGVSFSNEVKDHFLASPFIGLKYKPLSVTKRIRPYLHLAFEQVNIELFNFKISTNGAGQPRRRISTASRTLNSLRYGAGLEAQFSKRLYFDLQMDLQQTDPFEEPISGVKNFNNLSFQLGASFKLGTVR